MVEGPSLVLFLVQIYLDGSKYFGHGYKNKFSSKSLFLVQLICVDKNNLVLVQNIFGPLKGKGIRFPQAKSIGLEQTTINPCVKKM
jgi:hypothetical protein